MKRRILRSIIVMFTLLPLAAISTPFPHPADLVFGQKECVNGWNNAYASRTCRSPQISATGNFCDITAKCSLSDGHEKMSSITVRASDVSDVNNCNGNLKVGGC